MTRRARLLPFAIVLAAGVFALWPWSTSRAEDPTPPTGSWRLDPPSTIDAIAGYASELSVASGDRLHLHVATTPAARYRIEVYRIGWYDGAGGALVRCVPSCSEDIAGTSRTIPPRDAATGELHAGWEVTNEVAVENGWRSGVYVAKLVLTTGPDAGRSAGIPFVVRAPTGTRSAVLVVVPVNTWQAYNDWGGLSLYTDRVPRSRCPSTVRYVAVGRSRVPRLPHRAFHRPVRIRRLVRD